ncbi:hypothetical protein AB0873_14900 [Micromonospora sp. NPDC047707]|uniref:hypothetical protein n=1 Tax=Micromonospora sp. NPDC047707 TaxID=3154498 RepID=UPI0034550657
MPSDFERRAISRLVDKATALGVPVPPELTGLAAGRGCGQGNGGAILWARANPDADGAGCCWGDAMNGPEGCTCWVPRYPVAQADPRLPVQPGDIQVRPRMFADCAFRPDSPEQAEAYTREALLSLPEDGQPFWCHQDMRRPTRWEHPDGRRVDGDAADYQPPIVAGVPFRTDGQAGLLCAGWAAHGRRAEHDQRRTGDPPDT